jgi:hypothetical protein
VDLPLDGVEGDGVVRGVGGEDRDGIAGTQGIDGSFVGFRISRLVGGVGVEARVEAIVDLGDVLV